MRARTTSDPRRQVLAHKRVGRLPRGTRKMCSPQSRSRSAQIGRGGGWGLSLTTSQVGSAVLLPRGAQSAEWRGSRRSDWRTSTNSGRRTSTNSGWRTPTNSCRHADRSSCWHAARSSNGRGAPSSDWCTAEIGNKRKLTVPRGGFWLKREIARATLRGTLCCSHFRGAEWNT